MQFSIKSRRLFLRIVILGAKYSNYFQSQLRFPAQNGFSRNGHCLLSETKLINKANPHTQNVDILSFINAAFENPVLILIVFLIG